MNNDLLTITQIDFGGGLIYGLAKVSSERHIANQWYFREPVAHKAVVKTYNELKVRCRHQYSLDFICALDLHGYCPTWENILAYESSLRTITEWVPDDCFQILLSDYAIELWHDSSPIEGTVDLWISTAKIFMRHYGLTWLL